MKRDLKYLSIPLPESVLRMKMYGDYEGALKMIDYLMGLEKTSQIMRERLAMEKEILEIMGDSEYPYDFQTASGIMAENIKDYQEEELVKLKETGEAD